MSHDLRYAVRALAAAPGFAAAAILTLALGIGANTAIFSAVYGVLLKPLPYASADRLVRISETRRGLPWNVAYANYLDWRARNHVFAGMAIFNTYGRVVLPSPDGSAAQVYPRGTCETSMLAVMGIPPAIGRLFTDEDAAARGPAVAILTDAAWRQRFGGDPAVVGRTIKMDDGDVTVVGVLPPGVKPFDVDVWFPLRPSLLDAMQLDRANHPGFGVVARLRSGIGVEQAQRDLSAIAASLEREYPASNTGYGVGVRPMIDAVAGRARPMLQLLMASVAVLLLIACANVANLLLAKGLRRERETNVRAALGASRLRIARLFLVEGLVLGALGATAGLLLAAWGVRLIRAVPGLTLPRASEVAIDPHVLGFAAALGIVTAAVFALAPALHLSRVDLMRVLRQAGSGELASAAHGRLRALLVAGEVALLVVLLAAAALTGRSLRKLASADVGYDAPGLLAVPLLQVQSRYGDPDTLRGFANEALAALRGHSAIAGAAVAWPFDVTGFTWAPNVDRLDHPLAPGKAPAVATAAVTPGYFRAMGIPIRSGRDFGDAERAGAPAGAIVNETLAARFFAGENPIGRHVRAMKIRQLDDLTIVGVVGDTRRGGVFGASTPEMYVSFAQFPQANATVIVRAAAGDPGRLEPDVRAQIGRVDPNTGVGTGQRVSDALARSYGDRRALSWLLSVFAGLALALTMLGIASMVTFAVAQRIGEIGVRIALGAEPAGVVRMIVRGSLTPVFAGAAAGLLTLLPLSRLLRSYLYDVSPGDPLALAAMATGVLVIAAAVAAWVPARRAAHVDPLVALRAQ